MIVWLDGTRGVGTTTTAALVQQRIPGSRVLDAEKVGETLVVISPGFLETDDVQHRDPWRPLVVQTAQRALEFTGGTLVMPMTLQVEAYWWEIAEGLAAHGIPVRHVVLHADDATLRNRIAQAEVGPSASRFSRVAPYAEAARTWLHRDAEVVDTTGRTPDEVADRVVQAVMSPVSGVPSSRP